MGPHPPHHGANVLAITATVGKGGKALHDAFSDVGASHLAKWLAFTVGVSTTSIKLPGLGFFTGLGACVCYFPVILTNLILIAGLDTLLVGLTLPVGAEAFALMLPNLGRFAGLGARLRGFAFGIRSARLAGRLLNLDPDTFLSLGHHRLGVLGAVAGS